MVIGLDVTAGIPQEVDTRHDVAVFGFRFLFHFTGAGFLPFDNSLNCALNGECRSVLRYIHMLTFRKHNGLPCGRL